MKRWWLLTGVVLLWSAAAMGEEWPEWHGPNRDCTTSEKGLLSSWPAEGPGLVWAVTNLGKGWSSPSITKEAVYVAGMVNKTGYVFAFGLDGRKLWQQEIGSEWVDDYWAGSHSTPTVRDERVYISTVHGRIVCLDAKDGHEIWAVESVAEFKGKMVNPGHGTAQSLLVDGDNVICTPGGKDASVVSLDKNTGKTLWRSKGLSDMSAFCSPIAITRGTTRQVVIMTQRTLAGIDVKTGAVYWQQPARYVENIVSPLYFEGHVFITGRNGAAACFTVSEDGKSVVPAWTQKALDNYFSGAVLFNGHIYSVNDGGVWLCLDAGTGTVVREEKALGAEIGPGSAIAADGKLYVYGDRSGTVGLVEETDGGLKVVGKVRVSKGNGEHYAHLGIAGKRLYVRHGDALMAFDIAAK